VAINQLFVGLEQFNPLLFAPGELFGLLINRGVFWQAVSWSLQNKKNILAQFLRQVCAGCGNSQMLMNLT
jgi:hypothetical protein